MPNTKRFFNVWPKSDNKFMFMNPEAEHLSFEARLERRQVSTPSPMNGDRSSTIESHLQLSQRQPLTDENANPSTPTPYSTLMGASRDTSHLRVVPNMKRTPSDKLNAFKRLLSTKKRGNKFHQQPCPTQVPRRPPPGILIEDPNWDPLPKTIEGLEVRLQYHADKLEKAKRDVRIMNSLIVECQIKRDTSSIRYDHGMAYSHTDLGRACEWLGTLVKEAREYRDSYGEYVSFHRNQTVRIVRKIMLMRGPQAQVPEIYKKLWKNREWGELFSV
jgi:hypothetical protein